jgi:hypothetical protein
MSVGLMTTGESIQKFFKKDKKGILYFRTLYCSGVARTIIGGGDIHIFVFTYHKNNEFEKKLITQNMDI